ncbi:hypothetical protein [Shewanella sp. SR44-3]|uniref:hypothetical protein n=1 Tax=Shewanella sp. SR44-3 TaxID=2760936 RepID=UPI0015FCA8D4|nr:hypothetical protein [Shewanella sp. SR44-3]MBB1267835.1 hypothetical protein [Shewanella sp. SR44-3]
MKTNTVKKSQYYFIASGSLSLGLIYNVIEQDIIGTSVFLSAALLCLFFGFIKLCNEKVAGK